jgi:glutamine amidotransferase
VIAVLDYGIGNLRSAEKALQHLGVDAALTTDPAVARDAAGVVLPGVGAFGRCMEQLRESGLEPVVHEAVEAGKPFLGICVGMQMLFSASDENPTAHGLGIIPGAIRWIPPTVKRPQMQWNVLRMNDRDEPMFAGLPDDPWFYFVHSLHGVPDDPSVVVGTCDYGGMLNVAFRAGNVFAVQFHPEKSASAGLALLRNFVAGVAAPVGT